MVNFPVERVRQLLLEARAKAWLCALDAANWLDNRTERVHRLTRDLYGWCVAKASDAHFAAVGVDDEPPSEAADAEAPF